MGRAVKERSQEFVNYILELLTPFGTVRARKMFGGYGIYLDNQMIGLIAYNELYFKANPITQTFYAEQGSSPFIYIKNNKEIKMSYWKVLPETLEDDKLLEAWVKAAIISVKN
jgi:DNA transformation protein